MKSKLLTVKTKKGIPKKITSKNKNITKIKIDMYLFLGLLDGNTAIIEHIKTGHKTELSMDNNIRKALKFIFDKYG